MDTTYERDEAAPLISRPGIPTVVQDNRRPFEKQFAVYIILASTFFERIAFYILAANLAFNLESEKIQLRPFSPSTMSLLFSGISYITTIIFAVISDWKLGRAKTILVGFLIYLTGYVLAASITAEALTKCFSNKTLTSMTKNENKSECFVKILIPLALIAIGTSAVQANMAVFGAEQIQISKNKSRYFDKYVIVMNISAVIAVLGIRAVFNENGRQYEIPSIIATSILGLAAVLFIIGWRYYLHVNLNETVVSTCIPVVVNAFEIWREYRRNVEAISRGRVNSAPYNSISTSHSLADDEEHITIGERPSSFLDFAKATYGGKFNDRMVDDVKSLRKAFLVFTLLIPYWLIYHQLSSTFSIQARYMRYNQTTDLDNTYRDSMVAFVWLGDPTTTIVGVLILNMFVYKSLDARNRSLTTTTKFVIGMCFAVITMSIAGTVEGYRRIHCDTAYGNNQSTLSILYQLPQNIFMGLSEVFFMVASFEYAYLAAPRSAQTLFMSLRFCSLGVSSFLATGYLEIFSIISSPLDFRCPRDKDLSWKFDSYFFILGGVQLISMILFIVLQKKFRIIKVNPQQVERKQFISQISTFTD